MSEALPSETNCMVSFDLVDDDIRRRVNARGEDRVQQRTCPSSEGWNPLTKQIGKDPKAVFTYKGKPVTQVNTKAWYKALDRAGIEDFRWHDLRHTWASWLTQQGVPLNVIQEMGAWESAEMVRRYAHLAPEQFAKHARVVDDLLNGTFLAQPE